MSAVKPVQDSGANSGPNDLVGPSNPFGPADDDGTRSFDKHLSVPDIIRATSPDTLSELSYYGDRVWPAPAVENQASDAPEPLTSASGFKGWLQDFKQRNKGAGLVLLAQVFGTLMNVTTRLLELEGNNGKGMHPFQILFARMGITVLLSSFYMYRTKTPGFPFGEKSVRPLLVARGVGGFFGVFGMYYSLMYLPLADATVITFLAPVIACWAGSYILKEPFTRMEQLAAFISLFGVVLIARPVSFFSHSDSPPPPASGNADFGSTSGNITLAPTPSDDQVLGHTVTPAQRMMAVGLAMVGVCGGASALTTMRWIGKRAHPLISVNYFAVWCTVVSTVMMLALPDVGFLLPANLKEWGYLIFLGICGFIMQYLLTAGLAVDKSSRATNMIYSQMIFALFFDKIIFGTNPAMLSLIGSSLILGSAVSVALQKGNANKQEKKATHDGGLVPDEERRLVDEDSDEEKEDATSGSIPLRNFRDSK